MLNCFYCIDYDQIGKTPARNDNNLIHSFIKRQTTTIMINLMTSTNFLLWRKPLEYEGGETKDDVESGGGRGYFLTSK